MTVSELRTLVDNLDEYIHIPGGIDRLKKMVLHLAVSGQLVPQDPSEGTGEELYQQIQAEKAELVEQGEIRKGKILPEISEDEIPFEIPRSWRWTRVSDLGYSLGQKVPDEDFYYVDVASIDNESQHLKQPSILTAKDAPSRARKMVKKGTVIYSTVRPYLLNTTIIENEFDKELIASTAFAILHPFVGVDPWWLLRNLIANYFTDYTNRKSVGMAYPAINDAQFSMAIMPLPPLAEQERIVAKVDSLFVLIDQLAEVYKSEQTERSKLVASSLAQLAKGEDGVEGGLALTHLSEIIRTKADAKILRQTILHLAVSGQLVPQDPSEGSGEELYRKIQSEKANLVKKGTLKKQKLLKNITESETPFTIPSSWKWARLAEIGQVVGGGTPSSSNVSYYTSEMDGGIPWLTPADLRGYKDMYIIRGARNITKAGLQNSSARLLPKNTILFSSRAPIGHLAIAANELATNQGFKSVVPYSEMVPEYIYRWLQFYAPVIDANASGTTFREVSGAIVERQLIPLPPFDEQKRIVTKTTQLLNLITELEEHLVG